MIEESNSSTSGADDDSTSERELTKEDRIKLAKKEFDLILRVRMNGPLKMEKEICTHFGVGTGHLHMETLEKIGKVCKSGDTSRGSTYVDNGLLYGSALYRAESGNYVAGYKFLCKN